MAGIGAAALPWEGKDWRALAALLALCAPLYFWRLGDFPLDNRGEPREGVTAQEMVYHGNWLLPRLNGSRWPEKPLLFPWLGALASLAAGGEVTEESLRLPSAMMATLGIALAFLLARRLGDRGEAVAAAALLGLAAGWIGLGRRARIDMSLAVLMEAALYFFLRAYQSERNRGAWGLAVAVALALATLAKGPMGAIFPAAAIAGLLVLRAGLDRPAATGVGPGERGGFAAALRREAGILGRMHPILGGVIYLGLTAGWYVPAGLAGGREFLYLVLWRENVEMPLGLVHAGGHPHPLAWYVPYVFLSSAPGCAFLPAAVLWQAARARRAPTLENLFAPVWAGVFFAGLSLATGKRFDYLVILLPPLALATAAWLRQAAADAGPHRGWLELATAGVALAAVLAGVAVAGVEAADTAPGEVTLRLFGNDSWVSHARGGILGPALVRYQGFLAVLLAGVGVCWGGAWLLLRRRRDRTAAGLLGGATLAGALAATTLLLPEARTARTVEPFAYDVLARVGAETDGRRLATVGDFNFAIVFYLRRHIEELPAAGLATFLAPGGNFCIMTESVYEGCRAGLGPTVGLLLRSDYADERGRYVLLGAVGGGPPRKR